MLDDFALKRVTKTFKSIKFFEMAKGSIYYAEILFSYKSGQSKDRKTAKTRSSCVGYTPDDALNRLKNNPDKIATRLKKSFGKVRDLVVIDLEVIHAMGSTMYDIETGKSIKPNFHKN